MGHIVGGVSTGLHITAVDGTTVTSLVEHSCLPTN